MASHMNQIVAVDIGGTNARFTIGLIDAGRVVSLGAVAVTKTADHASFESAWDWFASGLEFSPPREAAIAVACPVQGDVLKLTNNPWTIRPDELQSRLRLDRLILI